MKPQAKLGLAMIAVGGAIWFFSPHYVSWGNHHYVRHMLAAALCAMGALILAVGARS